MKRALSFILLIALVSCFFTACHKTNSEENGKINILTTIFPPYDFASAVGGELVEVSMLMAPETDSHSYSGDNPSDILKIANCDLFIYIGGESEDGWVNKVLSSIEASGVDVPLTLNLSEYCTLLSESCDGVLQSTPHSHEHNGDDGQDCDEHHHDCSFDEHIWTSLLNAEKMVWAICEKLCEIDEINKATYTDNALSYSEKLYELDGKLTELLCRVDEPLIFADRFPFAYFAHDYGLEHYAAFSGCSSETEVSPTTLSRLATLMVENNIKNVFYIETSKSDIPDTLCRISKGEKYLLHSCHTVTEKQLDEGITYISLMSSNYETLRKAFSND